MNIAQTAIAQKNKLVSNDLIVFSHIPKTAGSTINEIIEANYDSESIFSFYGRKQLENTSIKNWIDDFNRQSKLSGDRSNSKVLRGHFGLGIHEFLDIDSCTYISVLRNPIERVISHYYYFARPESESKMITDDTTLESFLKAKKFIIADNYQTRFLSGLGWQRGSYGNDIYHRKYQLNYGSCTEEMLEVAKKNLDKYVLFGLQSRFTDSLNLFKDVLNWKKVNFNTQKNVNQRKPKRETIDRETLRTIEEENKFDMELYRYAEEIFDSQVENLSKTPKIVDMRLSWFYPDFPVRNNRKQSNSRNSKMVAQAERKAKISEVSKAKLSEGDNFFAMADYNQAINKYKEVVKDNPEYIPALNKLATCCIRLNAEDQAIAVFKRIIEVNPNRQMAHAKLARLLAKTGATTEAISEYKNAISLEADLPDWVFIGLGKALQQSKKAQSVEAS